MTEFAIACGCGRQMTADGRAGANAYRCGCGTRIKAVQRREVRECWYADCHESPVTAAPVSLCEEHQTDIVGRLAHHIVRWDWIAAAAASSTADPFPRPTDSYKQPKPSPEAGWVYFMRRERLIKIGTTTNLKQRAQQVNAQVLARIPGSYTEEAQLHRRFATARRHGEWFEPTPELVDLVNRIRADEGRPPITVE